MRLLRSYKVFTNEEGTVSRYSFTSQAGVLAIVGLSILCGLSIYATMASSEAEIKLANANKKGLQRYIEAKYQQLDKAAKVHNPIKSKVATTQLSADILRSQNNLKQNHLAVSTIFWVGEAATSDNGFIANNQSAWDGNWQFNYGGVDNPLARNKYAPTAFSPKENPFYVALPYNDIDEEGLRKPTAPFCQKYSPNPNSDHSWCKNIWIKIVTANKVAYAQWEDVGPYLEDDVDYVFGNSEPRNTFGSKAGIDVSPAVANYLGLADVDLVYWELVHYNQVPQGPWKDIVTTSKGYSVN